MRYYVYINLPGTGPANTDRGVTVGVNYLDSNPLEGIISMGNVSVDKL